MFIWGCKLLQYPAGLNQEGGHSEYCGVEILSSFQGFFGLGF